MSSFSATDTVVVSLSSIGTFAVMVAAGVLLRRVGVMSEQLSKGLAKIGVNLTIPCLLFINILNCQQDFGASDTACPYLVDTIRNVWPLFLWPLVVVGVGLLLGRYVVLGLGDVPQNFRKTAMVAVAFGNSTGMPLTLLVAIHHAFDPKTEPLGRVDPAQPLAVYLLLYPLLQWALGGFLIGMYKKDKPAEGAAGAGAVVDGMQHRLGLTMTTASDGKALEVAGAGSGTTAGRGAGEREAARGSDDSPVSDATGPSCAGGAEEGDGPAGAWVPTGRGYTRALFPGESPDSKSWSGGEEEELEAAELEARGLSAVAARRAEGERAETAAPPADPAAATAVAADPAAPYRVPPTSSAAPAGGDAMVVLVMPQYRRAGRLHSNTDEDAGDDDGDELVLLGKRMRKADVPPPPLPPRPGMLVQALLLARGLLRRALPAMRDVKDQLLQPPTMAIMVGLVIGLIPPLHLIFVDLQDRDNSAPLQWFFNGLVLLGSAAVPGNMLILGSSLASGASWKALPWRANLLIAGCKMVVMPAFGVCCALILQRIYPIDPELAPAFYLVFLMVTCTPTANNIMVMTEMAGENKQALATCMCLQYMMAPFLLIPSVFVFLTIANK